VDPRERDRPRSRALDGIGRILYAAAPALSRVFEAATDSGAAMDGTDDVGVAAVLADVDAMGSRLVRRCAPPATRRGA